MSNIRVYEHQCQDSVLWIVETEFGKVERQLNLYTLQIKVYTYGDVNQICDYFHGILKPEFGAVDYNLNAKSKLVDLIAI